MTDASTPSRDVGRIAAKPNPPGRIPLLDGWRAIAILAVITCHVGENLSGSEAAYAQSVSVFGQFGVDIFFGLSGLLITRLLLQDRKDDGSFNLLEFYIRRTFRILPPLLAFLTVYSLLGLWKSRLEFVSSVLFFRNYVPNTAVGFGSGHLWSLAIEEHFYLLWPGLLCLVGSRRGEKLAAAAAIVCGLWRVLAPEVGGALLAHVPHHFRTDLRLDALLWGCLAGCVLNNQRERERLAARLGFPSWCVVIALLVFSIRFYSLVTSIWVAVLIPLALVGTLVHPEWWISRILCWRWLAWIGRISYSLYLWQQLFLLPGWEEPAGWWQRAPWNLAAAFAVATASYYVLERPTIRLGRILAAKYRNAGSLPGFIAPALSHEQACTRGA